MGFLSSVGGIAGGAIGAWFGGPAGASAGYSIGSSAGGMLDNDDKDAYNAQMNMQNSAQSFNAQQAQLNRDWQTEMSNTAHQREVKDLKAAGLNPILSGTGGAGAATGSSSAATISPSNVTGIYSAKSQRESQNQQRFLESMAMFLQEKNTNADVNYKNALAASEQSKRDLNSAHTLEALARTKNLPDAAKLMVAQARTALAQEQYYKSSASKTDLETYSPQMLLSRLAKAGLGKGDLKRIEKILYDHSPLDSAPKNYIPDF